MTETMRHITLGVAAMTVFLAIPQNAVAGDDSRDVLINSFRDNWEITFGAEHLSFYSDKEQYLEGLSNSPFASFRSNFGASASIGKWFSPEIGLRTKGSGYWGRAICGDDPMENNIKFYTIQEQVLFNVSNLIMGYNPMRRWNVVPFIGAGFVRDCTHNENSIGASIGLRGTYAFSPQLKAHAEVSYGGAGNEFREGDAPSLTGKFTYYTAEVGVTLTLGKATWKTKRVKGADQIYHMTNVGDYDDVKDKLPKNSTVDYGLVMADGETPKGMVRINRGHLRMGIGKNDSLWGFTTPVRDISVDDFYIDKTEVTNGQYQEFIKDIMDSIVKQRFDDPYYGGDRKSVMESMYIVNPVTGEKLLDTRQLVHVYETYDYTAAMKRKYRIDPKERVLDTDVKVDENEVIMISKDTAFVDKEGNIVRQTITRPLSGPYDFLNTYVVNVYPDTTCWVNDFPNADNEMYARYYFSHPDYKDYPVVGVTWEQANAYCAWRTERMRKVMGSDYTFDEQPFRLPTEAEWEYAARGRSQNEFPWSYRKEGEGKNMFFANYMPDDGNLTKDGNIITSRVGVYPPNSNGLFDMAGNVAEWTSTHYTAAGIEAMNVINPQLKYNAAIEDPYRLKRKSVRGGSWKDSESHIRSAWRAAEYQNQPRSYIGFRCVRSIASTPSEKSVITVVKDKKKR